MLVTRDSRHHRRGRQADILDQLTRILRKLTGQQHRRVKSRRHGASPAYGRPHQRRRIAGRRAWLVKREISVWRLGLVVCVLLVVLWVGWRVVAQTAALSLAQSQPDGALGFVADQPVALNQLAQQEF